MPYLEHFASMPPKLFVNMLEDASDRRSTHFHQRLKAPTLIIAGERDGFTPARVSRAMADTLSQARYELIAEGSHTSPIEFPAYIERVMTRFFDDNALWKTQPISEGQTTLGERFRRAALARGV